jgi:hypothetical protein
MGSGSAQKPAAIPVFCAGVEANGGAAVAEEEEEEMKEEEEEEAAAAAEEAAGSPSSSADAYGGNGAPLIPFSVNAYAHSLGWGATPALRQVLTYLLTY